jgi:hypothetical protein
MAEQKMARMAIRRRGSSRNALSWRRSGFTLLLLDHDLGGLDHGRDSVANLEIHFDGAAAGDYAFDEIVSNLDHHVSHYPAELEFGDFALKAITR